MVQLCNPMSLNWAGRRHMQQPQQVVSSAVASLPNRHEVGSLSGSRSVGVAPSAAMLLSAAFLVTSSSKWRCYYRSRPAAHGPLVKRQAVTNKASHIVGVHHIDGLEELRRIWFDDIRPSFAPEIDRDPYMSPPDVDSLLARFLKSELDRKGDVASAAARLRETAEWRRDYCCMDFHKKGMARKLFMHASNPGASLYFADIGLRDRSGDPVMLGRVSLMTDDKAPGKKLADHRIPSTHLRAGMFVVERLVHEARDGASYILDCGPYPKEDMARHSNKRYWDADGVLDCSVAIKKRCPPSHSVGPHMKYHESMEDGLPVLKEAMRMTTTYFPEQLQRVYFYRPGFLFRAIFAIFSLWVSPATRKRLIIVNEGEEHKHFLAPSGPGTCDAADVPKEFGGSGASLDGDHFLARAMERYDATADLPAQ